MQIPLLWMTKPATAAEKTVLKPLLPHLQDGGIVFRGGYAKFRAEEVGREAAGSDVTSAKE
jgi:6-phosphogluconate dehydrogenase (decarboxylating)